VLAHDVQSLFEIFKQLPIIILKQQLFVKTQGGQKVDFMILRLLKRLKDGFLHKM
jgi:hypothetical protein